MQKKKVSKEQTAVGTVRLLARSLLLPASAMTMLGLPWRCSSLTHDLALSKDSLLVMSKTTIAACAPR